MTVRSELPAWGPLWRKRAGPAIPDRRCLSGAPRTLLLSGEQKKPPHIRPCSGFGADAYSMGAQKARTTVGGLFFADDDHVAVGVIAVLHTVDGELHARPILAIDGVNIHAVIGVIDHIGSLGDGIAR